MDNNKSDCLYDSNVKADAMMDVLEEEELDFTEESDEKLHTYSMKNFK